MNGATWLERSVSRLRPSASTVAKPDGAANGATTSPPRSTRERLRATLRQRDEALSPRALRRMLADLKGVIDPGVSEVEGSAASNVRVVPPSHVTTNRYALAPVTGGMSNAGGQMNCLA